MPAAAENPTVHTVSFERNTVNNLWRCRCTCGFIWCGEEQEVQSKAAVHDVEWVPAEPVPA